MAAILPGGSSLLPYSLHPRQAYRVPTPGPTAEGVHLLSTSGGCCRRSPGFAALPADAAHRKSFRYEPAGDFRPAIFQSGRGPEFPECLRGDRPGRAAADPLNLLQVGGFYGAQHLLTVSAEEPPGFAALSQAAPAPVQVLPDLPAQPPPCARNQQAPSLRSGLPGCARMGVRAALRAALHPGSRLSAPVAVTSGISGKASPQPGPQVLVPAGFR